MTTIIFDCKLIAMPVIDNTSPAYNQNSTQYWQDELENARILLYETNKAIQSLTTGNHQSYQIDTGNNSQRVTRLDLSALYEQSEKLTAKISALELYLGKKQGSSQIIPGF